VLWLPANVLLFCLSVGADCRRFQFECVNSDDPSLSECIAVYDRCNAVIQCRDGSDEVDCPSEDRSEDAGSDSSLDTEVDDLAFSLSSNLSQPSDVELKKPPQRAMFANTVRPDMLGQFSNESQSKGSAAGDSVFDGRNNADRGGKTPDEEHLEQLSDSVARGRPILPGSDGNTDAKSYHQKDTSGRVQSSDEEPGPGGGKPVGRPHGHQVLAGSKVAEGQMSNGDDTVSQRGHLLLSSMVDNSDEPKHSTNTRPRYPAVESGRKVDVELDRHDGEKSAGEYRHREVSHSEPSSGDADDSRAASVSVDKAGISRSCTFHLQHVLSRFFVQNFIII